MSNGTSEHSQFVEEYHKLFIGPSVITQHFFCIEYKQKLRILGDVFANGLGTRAQTLFVLMPYIWWEPMSITLN